MAGEVTTVEFEELEAVGELSIELKPPEEPPPVELIEVGDVTPVARLVETPAVGYEDSLPLALMEVLSLLGVVVEAPPLNAPVEASVDTAAAPSLGSLEDPLEVS